jgi:aryl-alcohol dehydrogenase-like predicted oxidoreductase
MGMSIAYGTADDTESTRVIHRALDLGISMLDTADAYGLPLPGHNERLIGAAIRGRRGDAVVATKFGMRYGDGPFRIDSSGAWARQACEQSLRRLGLDTIDLYYLHRRNPDIAIEETVEAMAGLVQAGKVRHLGLSEVSAETLRAAHAVHPITAVQIEYSLFSRFAEHDLIPTCRQLGVGVVAYSPLGRGLLTGALTSTEQLQRGDQRLNNPRFSSDNLARNLRLVAAVRAIASDIGCTPAQLAIAWLLNQNPNIVPIPGAKRIEHLEENAGAEAIVLAPDQVARIGAAIPESAVAGDRLPPAALNHIGH